MGIKDLSQGKRAVSKPFLSIWGLSIFGNLFIIFLSRHIHELSVLFSISFFVLISLFFGLIAHYGVKLVNKIELDSLNYNNFLKSNIIPAIGWSITCVITIFLFNRIFIKIPVEDMTFLQSSPFWAKITSSLYEGINLEIFFRLFLLSFIYFLLKKLFKRKELDKYVAWASILLAALASVVNFIYVDHLTQEKMLISNLVGGTVFGYLFIYKSLWAGIIAHFLVDFLLNGI